jgi:hypothetical protein
VWQLAAEHITDIPRGSNRTSKSASAADDDSDEEDEGSSSDSDSDEEPEKDGQSVAFACEDGCVRIFEVGNALEGLVYRRSLPRVKGRPPVTFMTCTLLNFLMHGTWNAAIFTSVTRPSSCSWPRVFCSNAVAFGQGEY